MKDKELKRRCQALAIKECANYSCKECLDPDLIILPWQKTAPRCHAVNHLYSVEEGAISCDFFLFYVLPLDPELNALVWAEINQPAKYAPWVGSGCESLASPKRKNCIRCKKEFLPGSNRQKYCMSCAKAVEQSKRAQRARERRAMKKDA